MFINHNFQINISQKVYANVFRKALYNESQLVVVSKVRNHKCMLDLNQGQSAKFVLTI